MEDNCKHTLMKYNWRNDTFVCDDCGIFIMTKDEAFSNLDWDECTLFLHVPVTTSSARASFNRGNRK